MAERVTGRIVVHPRGFGFLELDSGETAFVAPPDLNPFVKDDRVSAEVSESQPGKLAATQLTLVERTRHEVFGSMVMRGGRPFVRIDREVANSDWPVVAGAAAEGTVVVAAIEGQKLRVVREVPETDASLERVIVRHGIRSTWAPEVLAAARAAAPVSLGGRRDLRTMPFVTIDAPVSRDLDDALAVLPAASDGALRVLVAIADVDSMVSDGSAIDAEARARGTSVYLAGRVLPMLPAELSEQALSLLPGEDRPALVAELRIDPEGTVRATDLYEALIRSHARLDYDGVAAFLDQGDSSAIPDAVRDTMRWLRTAAARIAITRGARGGVTILREEAYVSIDTRTGEPSKIVARESTSAHVLVERLMVAANEAVARWLCDRGLPGVYRVHPAPDERSVASLAAWARNFGFEPGFGPVLTPLSLAAFEAQFASSAIAPAVSNVLGRALGPARYTVHPGLHFGLAAPLYLHFTSPIRRYADLAVHRIVKAYLRGERDQRAGDESLEALATRLNELAYRATKAENERVRMLAARLFATKVGEAFRGNVIAVKPFGLVVQLVGTAVTGTIATELLPGGPFRRDGVRQALVGPEHSYAIGDPIDVVITGTNEDLGRIDLAPRATGAAAPPV